MFFAKFSLIFSESVSINGTGLKLGRNIVLYKAYMKHFSFFRNSRAMPNPFSFKRKHVFCSNSKTIRDRNVIFGMIVDLYNV